jgi:hypothetical protein
VIARSIPTVGCFMLLPKSTTVTNAGTMLERNPVVVVVGIFIFVFIQQFYKSFTTARRLKKGTKVSFTMKCDCLIIISSNYCFLAYFLISGSMKLFLWADTFVYTVKGSRKSFEQMSTSKTLPATPYCIPS